MERFRGQLLDGNRDLLDDIETSITISEWSGIPEWRGRFWLPDSSRIQPGGKFRPIRDAGRAGERIVASSGPSAAGGHVAVFEGHGRFE